MCGMEWGNPDNPNIFEKKGYTKEDLKKGVRNPYFDMLCRKVNVPINDQDYGLFKKIAVSYGFTPEYLIQTYLYSQAELLRKNYPDELNKRKLRFIIHDSEVIKINKFEWDEEKNKINKAKHKISFEDAIGVFKDMQAITIYDLEHSEFEDRFIIIGFDIESRHLAVCHCCRGKNKEIIRIISARTANKIEIQLYKEENGIL